MLLNNAIVQKLYAFVLYNKYGSLLFKGLIILACLVISAGLPLSPFAPLGVLLIALPFLLIGAYVINKYQGIGMAFIVFASLQVPFQLGTGTGSSINSAMIALFGMIGLWILKLITKQTKFKIYDTQTFVPLLVFIVFAFISFLTGQIVWYAFAEETSMAAQVGGFGLYLFSGLGYWWVANQIDDVIWLKWAALTLVLCGGLYYFAQIAPVRVGRVMVSLFPQGAAGSLFFLWTTAMAFSMALYNEQLKWHFRVVLMGIVAVSLHVTFIDLQAWVSGYGPIAVGLGIIVLVGYPRWAIVMGIVGLGGILYKLQDILSQFLFVGDNAYSLGTRIDAWVIVGKIASISPILGIGPSNYYNITPLFPIRGYAVVFNSHSQYVDLFAQTGIVGLICFFWFHLAVGKLGLDLLWRTKAGTFERAYVICCLGGVVGHIVSAGLGDWIIPFVYNIGFTGFRASILGWIFLGGLVVIKRMLDQAEADEASKIESSTLETSP